jgi:prefoldin subunit 5
MIERILVGAGCLLFATLAAQAQDVPGIEICTVEKTMERRTSCLQSNVDFLTKTISKLNGDHQLRFDAAARQIEMLKASLAGLQKTVEDLKAAQAKVPPASNTSGKEAPVAAPAAKEAGK